MSTHVMVRDKIPSIRNTRVAFQESESLGVTHILSPCIGFWHNFVRPNVAWPTVSILDYGIIVISTITGFITIGQ